MSRKPEEFQTKKRKIGTLKIKETNQKTIEKPIWCYAQNNYWTDHKNTWVLNVNFQDNEQHILSKLMSVLWDKGWYDKSNINAHPINVHVETDEGITFTKKYTKLFVNIDTTKVSFDDFLSELNDALYRTVTTYGCELDIEKINNMKLDVVAQII